MDEAKPAARLPTVEHREPYELRGSRTVLGAPGGEIPPGDSTTSDIMRVLAPLAPRDAQPKLALRYDGRRRSFSLSPNRVLAFARATSNA